MDRATTYLEYQPLLQSIALRMVGTLEDAEDIVHDTFERWLKTEQGKILNDKAYLVKSVSNNCLQYLTSLKNRLTKDSEDVEETTFEIEDEHQTRSIFSFDLEAQLAEAWAIIHAKLEPIERKLFIMREVFNLEYEELQLMVDKKKENCRKIVSRAKIKLQEDSRRLAQALPRPSIPNSFQIASKLGFAAELVTL